MLGGKDSQRRILPSRKVKTASQSSSSENGDESQELTVLKDKDGDFMSPRKSKHAAKKGAKKISKEVENPPEAEDTLSELNLDGGFESPSNPTKKNSQKRHRKQIKPLAELKEGEKTAGSLFESVRRGGALHVTAEDWLCSFDSEGLEAMVDMLNFVLRSCGGQKDYVPRNPPADVNNMDADEWSAYIEAMIKDLMELNKVGYPLQGAGKFRRFRENFEEFWARAVEVCRQGAELRQDILAAAVNMLTTACSAPFKNLRHTATVAGLEIGSACLDAARSLGRKMEVTSRQLEAEAKKSSGSKKARGLKRLQNQLETGIAQLEEVTDAVFKGIFTHRYRDVHAETRCCCIKALGHWIESYSSHFLEDQYLKYLGWLLYDKVPAVRKATVESLINLYEDEEKIGAMEAFTVRFLPRMAEMSCDIDTGVQLDAFKLLRLLLKRGFFDDVSDEDLSKIDEVVFDEEVSLEVRAEALSFVFDHLAEFDPSSKANDESRRLAAQLEAIIEFTDYHLGEEGDLALGDLVVEACLKLPQAEVLTCWKSFFSLLLRDRGLTDRRLSILIRALMTTIHMLGPDDPSVATAAKAKTKRGKQKIKAENPREVLTIQLLKHLPDLLVRFSADADKCEHLVKLAAYLDPQVISVARYGGSFSELLKQLKKTFVQNATDQVLASCSHTINLLHNMEGHGKQNEISVIIQQLFEVATAKILEEREVPASQNQEFSLGLAMRQLRHLSFLMDPRDFIDLSKLAEALHDIVSQRCESITIQNDVATATAVVSEGLNLLTMALLWHWRELADALSEAKNLHKEEEFSEETNNKLFDIAERISQFQEILVESLRAALGMDLETTEDQEEQEKDLDEDQAKMVLAIQRRANVITGELRFLFKLGFDQFKFLDRLVWRPDANFMSLMQRFFEAEEVRAAENQQAEGTQDKGGAGKSRPDAAAGDEAGDEGGDLVAFALLPLMKAILYNFDNLNKRQTAAVVGHFVGSGKWSSETVKYFTQELKHVSSIRYLEVQMATLRLNFERWLLPAEEEQDIDDGYRRFVPLAQRLSQSLGIGALKGKELKESFMKFMTMGIQYSLDSPPTKFPFLEGLSPFTNKLTVAQKKHLKQVWDETIAEFPEDIAVEVQQFEEQLQSETPNEEVLSELTRSWKGFFIFQSQLDAEKLPGTNMVLIKGSQKPKGTKRKAPAGGKQKKQEYGIQEDIQETQESQEEAETSMESEGSSPWISPMSSTKSGSRVSTRSRLSTSALMPIAEQPREAEDDDLSSTATPPKKLEEIPSDDDEIFGALQSKYTKRNRPKTGFGTQEDSIIGSLVDDVTTLKEPEAAPSDIDIEMTPLPPHQRSRETDAKEDSQDFLTSQESVPSQASEGLMTEDEIFMSQKLPQKRKRSDIHEEADTESDDDMKQKGNVKSSKPLPESQVQEELQKAKQKHKRQKTTASVPEEAAENDDLFDDFVTNPFIDK